MKNRSTGRLGGFTLIELLVVVLIIGILSAVALPQYQMAVEKSRALQAIVNVRALAEAVERYYMANGEYPPVNDGKVIRDIDELGFDITLPKTKDFDYYYYYRTYVAASRSDGSPDGSYYRISQTLKNHSDQTFSKRGLTCDVTNRKDEDSFASRLCKKICGVNQLHVVWYSEHYGCEIQ